MAFHAKLSPSSAHRWMNCPGSVKLIGDESSTAGIEAHRGTAAHKVVETMIANQETDASAYLHCAVTVVPETGDATIYNSVKEAAAEGPKGAAVFDCDETMVNGVQTMIDEVERVRADLFDPELYTERYLDMSWLDPRLGGTADVTLYEPAHWIHLFDYKNGRMVVEVKDNEQMKNYAVGLLHEHSDADGVTVHLVQPNAVHEDGVVREESYTADELKLFEIQMKQAADRTSRPNAQRRAGDWCTFCPAKVRCPEFESKAAEEAGLDFADDPPEEAPPAVTDFMDDTEVAPEAFHADLARKFRWIPLLDAWARNVTQAIFNEHMNGRPVPGTKLVQGKSNRAYIGDQPTTVAALIEGGIPEEMLYTEPKLKSPAQVEKIRPEGMKAAMVKKIVAPLVHKPPGRIVVASESDPREAVDSSTAAVSDFADDPADDDFE